MNNNITEGNRQTKFRAWDGKSMIHNGDEGGMNGLKVTNEGVYYYDESNDVFNWYEMSGDYIFMQYIGLKDNNGKEIYEGDILAVDWLDQRYPPHTLPPVSWDDDNACWLLGEGGSPKMDAQSHMEIIGNQYQNPELLKH